MLRLRIDTDGDAFAAPPWGRGRTEVAYLLRFVAGQIIAGLLDGSIKDANGKACGQWDLRFDRSQEEWSNG